MNWKEHFEREYTGGNGSGGMYISCSPAVAEWFIETEIIEKLIEEIPDHDYSGGVKGLHEVNNTWLKKQLKVKWLGKEHND